MAEPANRDESGRFPKGRSGNPNGRPKVEGDIRKLAQSYGKAALMRLVELIDSDEPRVSVTAAQAVLDRAYGKPPQSIDLPSGLGPTLIRVEFVK